MPETIANVATKQDATQDDVIAVRAEVRGILDTVATSLSWMFFISAQIAMTSLPRL